MIGEDNMNWWNILKNTRLSGKAKGKGTTLSSDRIKIKKPEEEECKEKLTQYVKNAKNLGLHPRAVIVDERFFQSIGWQSFPERMACKAMALISRDWPSKDEILNAPTVNFPRSELLEVIQLNEKYALNRYVMKQETTHDLDNKEIPRGSYRHYFSYNINENTGRMLPHGTTDKSIWGIMVILHSTPETKEIEDNFDWRK